LRNSAASGTFRESHLQRNALANVLGTARLIGYFAQEELMRITSCLTVPLTSLAVSLTFTADTPQQHTTR